MSVQATYDREADIAWFRLSRFAGSARTEPAEWGPRDIDAATGATVGLEFWRARERLPSELLGFPLQMHASVPDGLPNHPLSTL